VFLLESSKWASFLDLPSITSRDLTSPVGRYNFAFSDPFSEHNFATRSRSSSSSSSSSLVGVGLHLHSETAQTWLHSPALSLVPTARPVVPEEEHEAAPLDASVFGASSFVSLPGAPVRKRPLRRDTERPYGSWVWQYKRLRDPDNPEFTLKPDSQDRSAAHVYEKGSLHTCWRAANTSRFTRLHSLTSKH
jgi:hypothetical protein